MLRKRGVFCCFHIKRRDQFNSACHAGGSDFLVPSFGLWSGARLIEEREHGCDEEPVLTQGSEQQVYARTNIRTCPFYVECRWNCLSGTGSNIKNEIEAIHGR